MLLDVRDVLAGGGPVSIDRVEPGVVALRSSCGTAVSRHPHDGLTHILTNAACWDLRSVRADVGPAALRSVDVGLLHGGASDLGSLARRLSLPVRHDLDRLQGQVDGCLRASAAAGIDVGRYGVLRLVPPGLSEALMAARGDAILAAHGSGSDRLGAYVRHVHPLALRLHNVEESGVAVDVAFVHDQLGRDDLPVHVRSWLEGVRDTACGGLVWTRLSPVGPKTGRMRVESGLNCLAVPHGVPRRAIVSRWPRGSILSVDFNAIDYRCIVDAQPDRALKEFYRDCDDFHARTTAYLFGEGRVDPLRRKIVKQITYTHMYGGNETTLSRQTGLSTEKVRRVLARLDVLMAPIADLRGRLWAESRAVGYVDVPDGPRVPTGPDDHPGKVLGLYAQGHSSVVFARSLCAAVDLLARRRSRVVFPVHDEMVVDLHPDEDPSVVEELRRTVDGAAGPMHRVKTRKGRNYDEATG